MITKPPPDQTLGPLPDPKRRLESETRNEAVEVIILRLLLPLRFCAGGLDRSLFPSSGLSGATQPVNAHAMLLAATRAKAAANCGRMQRSLCRFPVRGG